MLQVQSLSLSLSLETCYKGYATLVRRFLGWVFLESMGNCWSEDPVNRTVFQNAKLVQNGMEKTEKQLPIWPSNPEDVEHFRQNSTSKPLIVFTFNELKEITCDFRKENILGGGGFGIVYKGFVREGLKEGLEPLQVAVKVHNGDDSHQGHREWLAEVIYLRQLSHPNLVRLIGYCCEDEERVLIYEFMPHGSLESHLFSRIFLPLSWSMRMKIGHGVAKGLQFLHEAEKPVIFGDLKASNILLDQDFNAKLSDFGLAKDGPVGDQSHVSTRVMGTYGYTAPDYILTGHLSPRSDIYSFGVVLLELLTGRKAMDKLRPSGEEALAKWAIPRLTQKTKVLDIMDPVLDGDYPSKAVHKVAILAYRCLNPNPNARPLAREAVASLEPLLE